MLLTHAFLVGLHLLIEAGAVGGAQQARHDVHGARRVDDVDDRLRPVLGRDLHRRMLTAGRRAADEQRNRHLPPLHLSRDEDHLVERGRDESAQADHVGASVDRGLQDAIGGDHDAEIDHLVVVAPEDDADDVLADVVDVALDGGEHDLWPVRFCPMTLPFSSSMNGRR